MTEVVITRFIFEFVSNVDQLIKDNEKAAKSADRLARAMEKINSLGEAVKNAKASKMHDKTTKEQLKMSKEIESSNKKRSDSVKTDTTSLGNLKKQSEETMKSLSGLFNVGNGVFGILGKIGVVGAGVGILGGLMSMGQGASDKTKSLIEATAGSSLTLPQMRKEDIRAGMAGDDKSSRRAWLAFLDKTKRDFDKGEQPVLTTFLLKNRINVRGKDGKLLTALDLEKAFFQLKSRWDEAGYTNAERSADINSYASLADKVARLNVLKSTPGRISAKDVDIHTDKQYKIEEKNYEKSSAQSLKKQQSSNKLSVAIAPAVQQSGIFWDELVTYLNKRLSYLITTRALPILLSSHQLDSQAIDIVKYSQSQSIGKKIMDYVVDIPKHLPQSHNDDMGGIFNDHTRYIAPKNIDSSTQNSLTTNNVTINNNNNITGSNAAEISEKVNDLTHGSLHSALIQQTQSSVR